MDNIEIIVTEPDTATPSTSSTALDKMSGGKSTPSPKALKSMSTTSTASKPQLESESNLRNGILNISPTSSENHLNRTRHHPHHHLHMKTNFRKQSIIIEQNNEKENEEYNDEDESKKLLLPSSSSSTSLQHSPPSKKVSIVPSASTSHLRSKPNYRQFDNSSLSGYTTAMNSSSSAEPSSTTSPIGSPLPVSFTIGPRAKQYHSMRSVRSGEFSFYCGKFNITGVISKIFHFTQLYI